MPIAPNPAEAELPLAAPAARSSSPHWQILAIAIGVAVLGYVVYSVGVAEVLETFVGAAPWMPLIMLADLGFFFSETMAYRAVLGPQAAEIPRARFLRASLLYYCVMVLAPLGRFGAEVARGAAFTPWVGAGRATAAAGNMQSGVLLANFAISVPAYVAVAAAVGPLHPLAGLLALNAIGTGVLGVTLWLVARHSKLGTWLGARIPRLAKLGADLDGAARSSPREIRLSVLWCTFARVLQLAQYAVLLSAIGATVTFGGSLVAFGVHLVGAGFGDFVPNQVGILEGAYRIFADAIGLAHDPARAVSIALLARISQMGIAGTSLVVLFFTRSFDREKAGS